MNLFHLLFLFLSTVCSVKCVLFDRYSGRRIEDKEVEQNNFTRICAIDVKTCASHEGSRVDGTCNNNKYPFKGAAGGSYLRLLSSDLANNNVSSESKNRTLPSAREVRTTLQSTGRVEDRVIFNMAAFHFLEFIHWDISALNGTREFFKSRSCCSVKNETDTRCMPIEVPKDDAFLRVTDIHCLNFTRAETFQDSGCAVNITVPEQVNLQTPVLDLSTIYGTDEESSAALRTMENGLLKMDNKTGWEFPIMMNSTRCYGNVTNKTACYTFGFQMFDQADIRTTTFGIFMMREHNRLARKLKELNPCWKDDRIFKVARQINIASAANVLMYELLPTIMGYRNMLSYGLIWQRVAHLTTYDDKTAPQVYAEYEVARRYFNTLLDGRVKRYDEKYQYVGQYTLSETLFSHQLLENNKTFEEINRGTFFQHAGKFDDIQDPEISENFFGGLQKAYDLPASDIQRGRDLGVRGYNAYRTLCGRKPTKQFEDLADVMNHEKIEALKKLYANIDDIDLLAGIMSENFIHGAFIGPTLFCILSKQIQNLRFGDRFWYERGGQPHSFSLAQLNEMRKANMARLVCDNAEGVKFIQPRALLNAGPENLPMPCTHILGPVLKKWKDNICERNKETKPKTSTTDSMTKLKNTQTPSSSPLPLLPRPSPLSLPQVQPQNFFNFATVNSVSQFSLPHLAQQPIKPLTHTFSQTFPQTLDQAFSQTLPPNLAQRKTKKRNELDTMDYNAYFRSLLSQMA